MRESKVRNYFARERIELEYTLKEKRGRVERTKPSVLSLLSIVPRSLDPAKGKVVDLQGKEHSCVEEGDVNSSTIKLDHSWFYLLSL